MPLLIIKLRILLLLTINCMSFFGNMKKMYDLQSKAKSAQKKLKNIVVESEDLDVIVRVTAEMRVDSIEIRNPAILSDEKLLTTKIIEHLNKAFEKAQKLAAEEMKEVMGDMDLSKLLGGQ